LTEQSIYNPTATGLQHKRQIKVQGEPYLLLQILYCPYCDGVALEQINPIWTIRSRFRENIPTGARTDDGGRRQADGSQRADGRRRTEAGGRITARGWTTEDGGRRTDPGARTDDGGRRPADLNPARATASDRQGATPSAATATSPRAARGFYAGVLESRGKEKGKVRACAGEAAARAETRDGKSLAARKYARTDLLDGNLAKFGKCFAKLLEHQFSSFAKKTRIASVIGKLLEMLL
jgi:hypothetical protein